MNELRVEKLRNDPQSLAKGTFGYDATGNRTAATWLGASTSFTYPSTSHRLSAVAGESRTYDSMGNPLTVAARQLRYDDRAKLAQVTLPGSEVWQYGYTGQGLRVTKRGADNASSLRHFVYDESAQLVGEYDHAGAPLREVIWLGSLPIGVIDGSSATPVLHYIESDHLGTPRVVVDATRNTAIWRWNQADDPFGRSAPNTNPDSDGTSFAFNLRFAGQYHDAETGWHYNVHRYYDPSIGRYLESDPIGLAGGISTYGYVGAAPLSAVDPLGLFGFSASQAFAGAYSGGRMTHTQAQGQIQRAMSNEYQLGVNGTLFGGAKGVSGSGYIAVSLDGVYFVVQGCIAGGAGALAGASPMLGAGNRPSCDELEGFSTSLQWAVEGGDLLIGGIGGPIDGTGFSLSAGNTNPRLGIGVGAYGALMGCGNYRIALITF